MYPLHLADAAEADHLLPGSGEWTWGLGFRPLEHFLADRKGQRLDGDQIGLFQGAITAVRESIALAPELDAALIDVLADTLDLRLGASPMRALEDAQNPGSD